MALSFKNILLKNKYALLLLLGLMAALGINSCKKSSQSPIHALFTGGSWQLASVLAFNSIGNSLISTDTLNISCSLVQQFTFNSSTCTYTNFDCLTQSPAAAAWSLAPNQLFLDAEVVCKDTTLAGSSKPFQNAKIVNLGQYSMILQTGDIQPNYSLTKPRRVVQYGFIRIHPVGTQ